MLERSVREGRITSVSVVPGFFQLGDKTAVSHNNPESGYGSQENISCVGKSRKNSQRLVSNLANLKLPPLGSIKRLSSLRPSCLTTNEKRDIGGDQKLQKSDIKVVKDEAFSKSPPAAGGIETGHQQSKIYNGSEIVEVEVQGSAELSPADSIIILHNRPMTSKQLTNNKTPQQQQQQPQNYYENLSNSSGDTAGEEDQYAHISPFNLLHNTLEYLFVAIFPFRPTTSRELLLHIGDPVQVLRTSASGWWKGRSLRNDDVGW